MVSFVERHLALIAFEVELLDAAAPITISSQLLNRQDEETEFGRSGSVDPRRGEHGHGAEADRAERQFADRVQQVGQDQPPRSGQQALLCPGRGTETAYPIVSASGRPASKRRMPTALFRWA